MLRAIHEYCAKTNQLVPEDDAQVARLIMESLALRYRTVFGWLSELASYPLEVLHIIGGGGQNTLLAQWTANSLGVPVLTGPTEATAIGNIMMQMKAIGKVKDIQGMRALVAKAIPLKHYEPQNREAWNAAYQRYVAVCE
jgi:rhamnulokinase